MTPSKLSNFYRLVGGNYDRLFLETPSTSLSFIYRSLGCYHALQPEKNPYKTPSLPCLLPHGFVRWQTVQLLLDPEEHVPFLQHAVKRFDLVNQTTQESFPCILPKRALPLVADADMVAWYGRVADRLLLEAQMTPQRPLPKTPPLAALSDHDESSRPTSAGSLSLESQSLLDAAEFFQHRWPPDRPFRAPSNISKSPSMLRNPSAPNPQHRSGSPLVRRSSYPEGPLRPSHPQSQSTQAHRQATAGPRRNSHARTPSTASTCTDSSDCSTSTTSSSSTSPMRHDTRSAGFGRPRARTTHESGISLHRANSHPYVSQASHKPRLPPRPAENLLAEGISLHLRDRESRTLSSSDNMGHYSKGYPVQSPHKSHLGSGLNRAQSIGAIPVRGSNEARRPDGRPKWYHTMTKG